MGKIGGWVSRAKKRGAVSAQASPPTLSDRTSFVPAVSIFSQNWKERKFGGHATSPSSRCQHPWHVVRGRVGAPSPSSSGGSLPPASTGAGLMDEMRGHAPSAVGLGRERSFLSRPEHAALH